MVHTVVTSIRKKKHPNKKMLNSWKAGNDGGISWGNHHFYMASLSWLRAPPAKRETSRNGPPERWLNSVCIEVVPRCEDLQRSLGTSNWKWMAAWGYHISLKKKHRHGWTHKIGDLRWNHMGGPIPLTNSPQVMNSPQVTSVVPPPKFGRYPSNSKATKGL